MIVLYSGKTGEVDIRATAAEFGQLSTKLLEDGASVACETDGITPDPYPQLLESVLVKISPGQPVELRAVEGRLVVSGDREKLSVLAENVANFGRDCLAGQHMHLEYYEGDDLFAESSFPTVLTHL